MAANEDATYYMAIQNPREFRRDLLESSKIMIQLLQRQDLIREIREEKVEKMYAFSKVMGEINMLSNRLRRVLPQAKLSNMPKSSMMTTHVEHTPHQPHISHESEQHVAKLQKELEDIERKLGMLD